VIKRQERNEKRDKKSIPKKREENLLDQPSDRERIWLSRKAKRNWFGGESENTTLPETKVKLTPIEKKETRTLMTIRKA